MGGIVSGIFGGAQGAGVANPAAYDPYAPYRGQAAQQLNALMANPSSVQNLPGFQAGLNLSNQSIQRQAAQTGMFQSGNELMALQNNSVNYQNQAYQQQLQNLAMLSGANQSPGQAASYQTQGAVARQQMDMQSFSNIMQAGMFIFG